MFGLGGQELILVLLFVIPFSFLPLSQYRDTIRNKIAIIVLNIFLGWSVIGRVVALVLSFTNDKGES